METLYALLQESDKFLLLVARLAGIAFAPIYSTRNLPALWKTGFILFCGILAWQYGLTESYPVWTGTGSYLLLLLSEVIIGMALSLVAQFFFAAVQLAGEILDTQMGFGIMNVIDPLSGTNSPILGNFKTIIAMLVFLQVNGHHYLLQTLFHSYQVIPVGGASLQGSFLSLLISFFGNIFVVGLQLALPITGALLFSDIILGIMSRTVPQMNIFLVGMPAKILLGFGVLLGIIPLYIYLLNTLISDMIGKIYQILNTLV